MSLVHLIASLALIQALVFGFIVGRARAKYGVKAPATTGSDTFERLHRVHVNTLELLVMLIPAMWMAAIYSSPNFVAVLGAVYLIGRVVYFRSYVTNPETRVLGFVISVAPIALMAFTTVGGASKSLLSATTSNAGQQTSTSSVSTP